MRDFHGFSPPARVPKVHWPNAFFKGRFFRRGRVNDFIIMLLFSISPMVAAHLLCID